MENLLRFFLTPINQKNMLLSISPSNSVPTEPQDISASSITKGKIDVLLPRAVLEEIQALGDSDGRKFQEKLKKLYGDLFDHERRNTPRHEMYVVSTEMRATLVNTDMGGIKEDRISKTLCYLGLGGKNKFSSDICRAASILIRHKIETVLNQKRSFSKREKEPKARTKRSPGRFTGQNVIGMIPDSVKESIHGISVFQYLYIGYWLETIQQDLKQIQKSGTSEAITKNELAHYVGRVLEKNAASFSINDSISDEIITFLKESLATNRNADHKILSLLGRISHLKLAVKSAMGLDSPA